jgi:hypothetical protein
MNPVSVIVHKFRIADVEDPMLYAGEPLYQWEQSEAGQWIMKHAVEQPVWNMIPNPDWYGNEVLIRAVLKPEDYTYWKLKYE